MARWKMIPLPDCLVDHDVGRANQINTADIQPAGRYPVVDQGQAYIAGYTDDALRVISDGLPYVIFGDHTRCFKYVDFPFVLGAEGTKVLKPNTDLFDPRFFYYAALSLDIPSRGYNRHFTLLKERSIPRPEPEEQRQIAAVLLAVQQATERQDRLVALTAELKKALMHKLFTEGIRGEPLKQTKIGTVPESWAVKDLEEVAEPPQYGFTASASTAGNAQILRITDIQDAGVDWPTVPYCDCPADEFEKFRLLDGDLVFARIGATTGKNFLVRTPPDRALFASYLIRVRPRKPLIPRFLAYYCQTEPYWRQIAASKGNNLKGGFNSSLLRRLLVPLPNDTTEQEQIADVFGVLDRKISAARSMSKVLNEGFHALLDQLMTAQLRVHDLDLSALGIQDAANLAGAV